jgi:F-type H+-transporting ATPase subunit epsilon
MEIQILTTEKLLLAGNADAVFLPAFDGEMEVLNGHTPYITALKQGIITVRNGSDIKTFPIEKGYADITPHKVVILSQA